MGLKVGGSIQENQATDSMFCPGWLGPTTCITFKFITLLLAM